MSDGNIRRLEDGPFGGTRVLLGRVAEGEAIECPLPGEGPWQLVGYKDLTLAQTAHQMSLGRLWVGGMPEAAPVLVPVAPLAQVIRRMGPHDLDLTGSQAKRRWPAARSF